MRSKTVPDLNAFDERLDYSATYFSSVNDSPLPNYQVYVAKQVPLPGSRCCWPEVIA